MMDTALGHADIVAAIPAGMPVRFEIDVAANAYRYVALTPGELKQRDDDHATAEQADAAANHARDELVTKLAAGKATDGEVQQALARLLDRS